MSMTCIQRVQCETVAKLEIVDFSKRCGATQDIISFLLIVS